MENHHDLLMDFTVNLGHRHGQVGYRAEAPRRGEGTGLPSPHVEGRPRLRHQKDCVREIPARQVTPHVAQKKKHSAINGRTTHHTGYAVSLRIRKHVKEVFGWMKTVGCFRCTRYRGMERTGLAGYLVAIAYN